MYEGVVLQTTYLISPHLYLIIIIIMIIIIIIIIFFITIAL
jgi:hypothetical protein